MFLKNQINPEERFTSPSIKKTKLLNTKYWLYLCAIEIAFLDESLDILKWKAFYTPPPPKRKKLTKQSSINDDGKCFHVRCFFVFFLFFMLLFMRALFSFFFTADDIVFLFGEIQRKSFFVSTCFTFWIYLTYVDILSTRNVSSRRKTSAIFISLLERNGRISTKG